MGWDEAVIVCIALELSESFVDLDTELGAVDRAD